MKSKGRIYKRHFYRAKYVIKGKKLKTSTAVVKRESKKEEVTAIGSIADMRRQIYGLLPKGRQNICGVLCGIRIVKR